MYWLIVHRNGLVVTVLTCWSESRWFDPRRGRHISIRERFQRHTLCAITVPIQKHQLVGISAVLNYGFPHISFVVSGRITSHSEFNNGTYTWLIPIRRNHLFRFLGVPLHARRWTHFNRTKSTFESLPVKLSCRIFRHTSDCQEDDLHSLKRHTLRRFVKRAAWKRQPYDCVYRQRTHSINREAQLPTKNLKNWTTHVQHRPLYHSVVHGNII